MQLGETTPPTPAPWPRRASAVLPTLSRCAWKGGPFRHVLPQRNFWSGRLLARFELRQRKRQRAPVPSVRLGRAPDADLPSGRFYSGGSPFGELALLGAEDLGVPGVVGALLSDALAAASLTENVSFGLRLDGHVLAGCVDAALERSLPALLSLVARLLG